MHLVYALIGILVCSLTAFAQTPNTFYVATTGSDRNPGTLAKPFATPEQARDAVRSARRSRPGASFTVVVRGGTYFRRITLELTAADSNTTYRAHENERVILHGGQSLRGSDATLCTDPVILNRLPPESRGRVRMIDLKKHDIADYGTLRQKGFGTVPTPAQLELFVNGQPYQLARYPNPGEPLLAIGRVYDRGAIPRRGGYSGRGGVFGYEPDNRPGRWAGAQDVWLHGKFSFGYADDHLPVAAIDTAKRTVRLGKPHLYGLMSSLYPDSSRGGELEGLKVRGYYAYNLLEEIDQPGEYYLDRKTGKLYLYPATDMTGATVDISILEDPLIRLTNTHHIQVSGLAFTCSRGLGIYQAATKHVTVADCQFSNLGTAAISFGQRFQHDSVTYRADGSPEFEPVENADFSHNQITRCTIFNTGTGGIFLNGGNRQTLESGHNEVTYCEFHHTDRIRETYSGGVVIRDGVGAVVRNCYFHDIKHVAILFTGNNHMIEYNRFERVCTDADDMGAVYTGRNPSARGTVIQHNFFSHIEPRNPETKMCGVYVDDGSGGIVIRQNLFYRTGSRGRLQDFGAIFLHGGFDNVVSDNIFLHCDVGVGHQAWDQKRFGEWLKSPLMQQRLRQEVNISSAVYRNAYPELARFADETDRRLNYVGGNVFLNTPPVLHGEYRMSRNATLTTERPMLPQQIDYPSLRRLLPNLKPFPLDQVGLP